MLVTKLNIDSISPFIRFAGQINFKRGAVTKSRCNADHRLFYIKRGKLTFHTNKESITLNTGDAVLLISGVPYRMEFEADTALIAVNFVFKATGNEPLPPHSLPLYEPQKFQPTFSVETPKFEDGFLKEKILVQRGVLELQTILDRMIAEFKRMEPLYLHIIRDYLTVCIRIMYRRFITGVVGRSDNRGDILDYLAENFASPITNKSIAEVFHYHPNYVNQLIKEKTGMSLHQYLLRLRLLGAADLLLYTETPINEVATLSGFSNAGYFSHYFKKCYGCSPSVFKGEKTK